MSSGVRRLAAALLIAALACSNHVTRDRWQKMSKDEKGLYVRSLLGAEKAKAAKGGSPQRYTGSADAYVARIDSAYGRGDSRDPDVIFAGLDDARTPSPAH